MPDHARSADPAVQAQLDRLWALSPGADVLGLERITRLLARLGDPHHHLPPVFHVAGTNGKGSTCAFLRAGLEAAGYRVHAYTSPHLVRFNERIRLAGRLIDDAALAALLAEVLDQAGDIGASFFEVTTAAAFLAFSRTPADACVIEVGLGGRLDATNVLPAPAVCGIAQLGIDHEAFLGSDPAGIAREKAGIAKRGSPLVTRAYPPAIAAAVAEVARGAGAPVMAEGDGWLFAAEGDTIRYHDPAGGLVVPRPVLAGDHQAGNAALALAMLRNQRALPIGLGALRAMTAHARWPARLQRLGSGPLLDLLPSGTALWLDGGHNPAAADALATALPALIGTPSGIDHELVVVLGMLANKDAAGLLGPLAGRIASVVAIPVPDHAHHAPADLAAVARSLGIGETAVASDVPAALRHVASRSDPRGMPPVVLILGSLYLAGEVLALNDELPD
jgi:dihydrofolate synthase / folylpolyglutamate synthase